MKKGIFISYSDVDKDKVNLIVQELDGNPNYFPIVIASNREALKPLAKKVADGISQAEIIVPILTTNSINAQWINQEIGCAYALEKRIMPIVESIIIDKLKGFIHKQIDLPYIFFSNLNKVKEHEDFLVQIKNLFNDIESDFHKHEQIKKISDKSDFEKSLEKADKLNAELEFKKQRSLFLNSSEGFDAAQTEVIKMFNDIESKIEKLKEKKYYFSFEKNILDPPTFILHADGFSFTIAWANKFRDTCVGALLYVRKWHGHLTLDNNVRYLQGVEPNRISNDLYSFDRNNDNEICWKNNVDNNQYTSEKIVDHCISWLLDEISNERLKKY